MRRGNPERPPTAISTTLEAGLRRYFRRRVPGQDVEDLVQDVLVSLQSRRSGSEIESLDRYVFAIAANLLSKRAGERHPALLDGQDHDYGSDITPERILIDRDRLSRARVAIERLPARTRHIFLLHRFEEMSYPRIARGLGISVSAVEKHIIAALKALRTAVGSDS